MYCSQCGKKIRDDGKFCEFCGKESGVMAVCLWELMIMYGE